VCVSTRDSILSWIYRNIWHHPLRRWSQYQFQSHLIWSERLLSSYCRLKIIIVFLLFLAVTASVGGWNEQLQSHEMWWRKRDHLLSAVLLFRWVSKVVNMSPRHDFWSWSWCHNNRLQTNTSSSLKPWSQWRASWFDFSFYLIRCDACITDKPCISERDQHLILSLE
jgi:hypothetical protein